MASVWGCSMHVSTTRFWCKQKPWENQINQKMCIYRRAQLHRAVTQLMLYHLVHFKNDPSQVPGGRVTLQTAIIDDNSGYQHRSLPAPLSPCFNISNSCLQTFRDERRWGKKWERTIYSFKSEMQFLFEIESPNIRWIILD